MSIQPPSDIVLDVASAADPATSLAATERLTRLAPADAAPDAGFSTALGSAAADSMLRQARAGLGGAAPQKPAGSDPHLKVYKGLEALILQNLVDNMLPKDATEYFGTGTAGEIWRSMLAEHLAKRLSDRIDLGLAARAEALHPPNPHQRAAGPTANSAFDAAVAGAGANRRGT